VRKRTMNKETIKENIDFLKEILEGMRNARVSQGYKDNYLNVEERIEQRLKQLEAESE